MELWAAILLLILAVAGIVVSAVCLRKKKVLRLICILVCAAAALLLAGLERRCGYCCVNTVHLQTRTLESLCLVYDSDMLLRLEPGEEETEDWIVRRSTPEQIRRTLRALVREGAPQ